jgi:long-chain acyl-CoA synthetase
MTERPVDSLANLLLDHPAGDDEALVCTVGSELTRAGFVAQAESLAAELGTLGVRPGHAVAVQSPSPVRTATGMFATWLAGAVFVPVNSRQTAREVEHILGTIRPAAMVGPKRTEPLDDPAGYDADSAFVTWTSGTTGRPKPILQTHSGYREILGRVLASIRDRAPAAGRARPTPNLVPVSLALNAGIYNLLFGFMAGAAVVLMDRFSAAEFTTLVSRYGIRSTVLPPAAMAILTGDDSVTDLSPLRYVRSITAPLSPLAARRFMSKFGVTVLNGYGQAEIGEVIGWTAADAREHPDKLGAVGRPHAGVAIQVVDEEGRPRSAGALGELLVKPPSMAAGYASGESLGDRIDPEGFVRTGDYATVDAEGFVWIEGRTSDLINRGGNKVFPDQVEEVIQLHPGVRESAVVGVPDERLGQVPVAFFVGHAPEEELIAVCRENLVPYKIPVAFVRADSLPRSDVGKVLRRELIDRWVAG